LGATPLNIASKYEHNDIVKYLNEFIRREEIKKFNSIFNACQEGNINEVKRLVEQGTNINKQNDNGVTPLLIACQNGHETIAKYLVEHGADMDKEDINGVTPLFVACKNGYEAIVKYLVENGVDINKGDNFGVTPLNIANKYERKKIEKYIKNTIAFRIFQEEKRKFSNSLINTCKKNNNYSSNFNNTNQPNNNNPKKLKKSSSCPTLIINSTKFKDENKSISLSMCIDDYEIGTQIGNGSFTVVYVAKFKPSQKTVCLKVIDLDVFERNQIDNLRKEIQIMSLCKHDNLLTTYGSFVYESKLYIVTSLLSAGSCLDIMKYAYPEGFEEVVIATILKQALLGLDYLHKNDVIHLDVKASNLLMTKDGLVQLSDFGVSSSYMETGEHKGLRKTFVGTPCWMAPEVMQQSGYDYKADIWSFGITALEMATGHAPYAKYPPIKVLMLILENEPPTLNRDKCHHKYSKIFKEMIDLCLNKDPFKR